VQVGIEEAKALQWLVQTANNNKVLQQQTRSTKTGRQTDLTDLKQAREQA
jgi:hypothetical protein